MMNHRQFDHRPTLYYRLQHIMQATHHMATPYTYEKV